MAMSEDHPEIAFELLDIPVGRIAEARVRSGDARDGNLRRFERDFRGPRPIAIENLCQHRNWRWREGRQRQGAAPAARPARQNR